MNSEVYIIVVSFNGLKWLRKCLDSTYPYQVILIDNNSNDGTPEFIKANYPKVILLEQEENLGFGKANNIGISHALKLGANHVFLLNQDAYLFPETIEMLVIAQKKNSNYGVISPIHLDGHGNRLDKSFSGYLNNNSKPHIFSDLILGFSNTLLYEISFINAAGWLISKAALENVGGFDPLFFHYGEDNNYCHRLEFHGYKAGVLRNSFLKHDRNDRDNDIKPIKKFDIDKYELSQKLKYSNINMDTLPDLEKLIRQFKWDIFKSVVKLNFYEAGLYKKKLNTLKKIYPQVKLSRSRNKKMGPVYLDL
ncbi:glycosyltransferase family 2 protein [Salinimicrobium sp. HB62]|uniref:glycosyltransferase family 2 protein n=1 Tax=Salinimicrobium sp. HB62 TaxID=3077781 RepID=UPI002D7974B5|nr:glycosyltransferase family 2 protein [Salinimicrobium sp. HB62]